MRFIDFHTHHASMAGETVIRQHEQSWGIHPKDAATAQWQPRPEGYMAIGECGLDHLCGVPARVQEELFRRHVSLSEEAGLPLIVHCVRAHEEILGLHRRLRPRQPWMVHGFRGKPSVMSRLLDEGMYISFGLLFNEESVRACPAERLLTETDDRPVAVDKVYAAIAAARGTTVAELAACMERNFACLYGNRGI